MSGVHWGLSASEAADTRLQQLHKEPLLQRIPRRSAWVPRLPRPSIVLCFGVHKSLSFCACLHHGLALPAAAASCYHHQHHHHHHHHHQRPNPTTTNNRQQEPGIAVKWFGHHKCLSSYTRSIDPWIGRSMIRGSIISSCSCSRWICCSWICLFVVCCCLFEREFDVVYFSQQLQQQ